MGSGYNSLTGATGADCVKRTSMITLASNVADEQTSSSWLGWLFGHSASPAIPATGEAICATNGQCVEFRLTQVKSAKQLREALGVDAKASFGFGAFSGDVSANYYKENKFSSENIYIVVSVKVTNSPERLKKLELTHFAQEFLVRGDLEGFLDSCGDSFIGGRTTGGEFTAVIKITSVSAEKKEAVEAKLRAAGIGWSASASVATALSEIHQDNTITVEMFKNGGVGALPNHADINEVFEFARQLPVSVQSTANPSTYLLTAMDYRTVSNRPRVNTILLAQQRALDEMATKRDEAYERLGDTNFILSNPAQFAAFDTAALQAFRTQIITVITGLNNLAIGCEANPQTCQMPEVDVPTFQFPARNPTEVPNTDTTTTLRNDPEDMTDIPDNTVFLNTYLKKFFNYPYNVVLDHNIPFGATMATDMAKSMLASVDNNRTAFRAEFQRRHNRAPNN